LNIDQKILAFEKLGRYLAQFAFASFQEDKETMRMNERFARKTEAVIENASFHNAWFTPEFIRLSFLGISTALRLENLKTWLSLYPEIHIRSEQGPRKIGIIMAGNIPLVGFHDFFCVIMSGNHCSIKLSSKDDLLFPHIADILTSLNKEFESIIHFQEGILKNPGAIIATGSNNSSRYFEYYFGKYPNLIRKNRNSVAILGRETSKDEMTRLADDIFSYFGMGCRNISKVFLPEGFDIPSLLKNLEHYSYLYNHNKYANNYDYHKAIHLVSSTPFFDTGFLVFKEDYSYSSPVGSLYYEFYSSENRIKEKIAADKNLLQCIVAPPGFLPEGNDFGTTQTPMLWDYADNVDTMKFLLELP
jgi:hypothetical protein